MLLEKLKIDLNINDIFKYPSLLIFYVYITKKNLYLLKYIKYYNVNKVKKNYYSNIIIVDLYSYICKKKIPYYDIENYMKFDELISKVNGILKLKYNILLKKETDNVFNNLKYVVHFNKLNKKCIFFINISSNRNVFLKIIENTFYIELNYKSKFSDVENFIFFIGKGLYFLLMDNNKNLSYYISYTIFFNFLKDNEKRNEIILKNFSNNITESLDDKNINNQKKVFSFIISFLLINKNFIESDKIYHFLQKKYDNFYQYFINKLANNKIEII